MSYLDSFLRAEGALTKLTEGASVSSVSAAPARFSADGLNQAVAAREVGALDALLLRHLPLMTALVVVDGAGQSRVVLADELPTLMKRAGIEAATVAELLEAMGLRLVLVALDGGRP